MLATDWGTVPQWLGLATGVVAVAAFIVARRENARTQASAVYIIVNSHMFNTEWIVSDGGGEGETVVSLEMEADVVNSGSKPITQCAVHLFAPNGRRRVYWWTSRAARDWWTSDRLVGRSYFTLAPESRGETLELNRRIDPPPAEPIRELPALLASFTDGNGRQWVRWPDGRLSRAHPSLMRRGRRRSKPRTVN